MGIMVYSLLWVVQDFVHQPYYWGDRAETCIIGKNPDYCTIVALRRTLQGIPWV